MKVKDVISSALKLVGREELVPFADKPSDSGIDDAAEVIETLLYCFNAVEDELARKYIPLVAREEMFSDGEYYFSGFAHPPVKIKKVFANGKQVKFVLFAKYMSVGSKKITVEYEFAPMRKNIDDESDYGDEVGEYLLALGVASEYAVINGEATLADIREKKYRSHLDGIQRKLSVCARIPPRRWV